MKKCLLCFLINLTLICCVCQLLQAQDSIQAVQENPLFTDEEVLHFTLSMNMQDILKDRGEERSYHKAVISYQDKTGATIAEELKVRVRGNRRRDPAVCKFPPLLLNFKRSTVQNTVFGNVNKVKLVTHCNGDDHVLREYLVYKLYNVVTDLSFKVRLSLVTYKDLQHKAKPITSYAFLIEDVSDMAARNAVKVVPEEISFKMEKTEPYTMARLAVFQFMIGNTDWSVIFRHNIEIVSADSLLLPKLVPYDFDYSGMVSAPYAIPPPVLGISSVRQRLFRGYHFTDDIYQDVIKFYTLHKEDFYNIYLGSTILEDKTKKKSIKYLDSFYKILDDSKSFHNAIVQAGEQNEKNKIIIKGLE